MTNPTNRLSEVPLRKPYEQVSVMAKDLKVKQPVHVSGGLTKQDIIIADETGRAILTLWESDVETVTASLLYHFNNIIVREYQGINIYHFPRRTRQYRTFPTSVMFPRKDLSECVDADLIIHVSEVISVLTSLSGHV